MEKRPQQLDIYQLHSCKFALGGYCEHSHKENSCIKCLTCFSFFKRKVLPFLENVNEEVSQNNKGEVVTMMDAVTNLSYAISHNASHCLCANVQFSDIERLRSQ